MRDPVVTAAFRKVGGPSGGGYGVIVLDQGPGPRDGSNQEGRFHVLEAGDRGEIGVWRRDSDGWIDVLRWLPSRAVRPGGATNELTVRVVGPRLAFSVNGTEVWSGIDDQNPGEGLVGVFVGGDSNEVVLERFVVQASD